MRFNYTSVGNESGLIQAYYPGGAPMLKEPGQVWKEGNGYKSVSILFNDMARYPNYNFKEGLCLCFRCDQHFVG